MEVRSLGRRSLAVACCALRQLRAGVVAWGWSRGGSRGQRRRSLSRVVFLAGAVRVQGSHNVFYFAQCVVGVFPVLCAREKEGGLVRIAADGAGRSEGVREV
jgi:hypothetical protein